LAPPHPTRPARSGFGTTSSDKAGPLGFWHHRPVDLCAAVAAAGMKSQPHNQSL
jgi:hypothetical protein